jgi:hypothetical protein
MVLAQLENWCKRISYEHVCHPVFRKLAFSRNSCDDHYGFFSIEFDNDGSTAISVDFSIWHDSNSEKRTKVLAFNELDISLVISDAKEIINFENKFGFVHDNSNDKVANDSYTKCKLAKSRSFYKDNYIIYLCRSDLSYGKYIDEIDKLNL